jgi:HAD superfamily hydrolase (TIGR01450 family)
MQETALPDLDPAIARRLADATAYIFDMDGTLVLGDAASGGHKALPGAANLLSTLRSRGTPFRVFTNGTAKPPSVYAASLRHAGLDVADHEMMTPSTSAAAWFVRKGIGRVRVLGLEGVQAPLIDAGIDVIGPSVKASNVEAVFTGWFREFTLPDLEMACSDVWDGAIVTTASNVPFFAALSGRAIGASFAINAMIRAMTGKQAKVLGKPSQDALHSGLALMNLPRSAAKSTVIVGDDPALEMRMARVSGALGVAVTTGLNNAADFLACAPSQQADVILSGLEPIVKALS